MADTAEVATSGLDLSEHFPPVSTSEWEAAIQADRPGADYQQKLVWKTDEGIAVRPYYRREHLAGIPDLHIRGPVHPDWDVIPSGSEPPAGAIRGDRFHEHGATALQELAYSIAEAVDRVAALTDSGVPVPEAVGQIEFVMAVGSNYFFEIAKLRALRLLWSRAAAAFGVPSALTRIHARTALSNKSIYDPYTNLLRATTEALSAAIGGCDSLEVRAFRFPQRLADNVQYILKEEAHIARVADPAGGSYYIEALTEALALEAWKMFLQVEAQGGFADAKPFIDNAIAFSRAAKEKALASRRKVLTGVNHYPDLSETALDEAGAIPADIWREAAPFETIRLRTEWHARKTGRRPAILSLVRGDLKMRQARAQFVQNFFGCGGFAIEESDSFEGSDADLIVLCSSDAEYLALAQEVCPKVRVPVIVAGNPTEHREALDAAGVAGYVHMLSNMVGTLTYWQNRLGIGGRA